MASPFTAPPRRRRPPRKRRTLVGRNRSYLRRDRESRRTPSWRCSRRSGARSAGASRVRRVAGGWCVYVLRCRDGSLYTGATNALARRLAAHARGKGARYTRSRLPVALVLLVPCRGRGPALRREAAMKRLGRTEKLELLARARGNRLEGAAPYRVVGSDRRANRSKKSPRFQRGRPASSATRKATRN